MSYCRWSSDDYRCDVYVYESQDGFETHVAGRRWVYTEPLPPVVRLPHPFTDDEFAAWYDRERLVSDLHGDETKGHWLNLPEPEGGSNYLHDTPGECAANLRRLAAAGVNVPESAITALEDEHTDTTEGARP